MNGKKPEDYELYDFLMDDSFVNFYFKRNIEDINYWQDQLNNNIALQTKADEALDMLSMLSLTLPESEFREEFEKLNHSISVRPEKTLGTLGVLPVASRWSRKRKISFTLGFAVILLGAGLFILRPVNKTASFVTVSNKDSVGLTFNLKDGTEVTLGPNSSLHYPVDFNDKERRVYLDGEARFHVKRDTARPFKVFEDELVATVLGTIFHVEKNKADSVMDIKLVQGSLKVDLNRPSAADSRTIYLKPNEQIIYRESTGLFVKEAWNTAPAKNITNHLLFKNASFQTVAQEIREVFGVTLINQSQKKNWRFTAEFTNVEFKEVLENICIVEGLTSKIEEDSVLLR